MSQRNIDIALQTWDNIAHKANEAQLVDFPRGDLTVAIHMDQRVTEALFIITANAALIVSTENNKAITVMDRDEAISQIFTKSMEP
ncbi:hypothetical protein M1D47_08390 [Bacillus sp. R1-10]